MSASYSAGRVLEDQLEIEHIPGTDREFVLEKNTSGHLTSNDIM